jgi:hypothetical protein
LHEYLIDFLSRTDLLGREIRKAFMSRGNGVRLNEMRQVA